MCFKCFLLSYLERNKIVKIPQRYDDEWEANVEIDEGEEINTEKIRAVVMPILTTPADSNDKDVKMHKLTEGYHDESDKLNLMPLLFLMDSMNNTQNHVEFVCYDFCMHIISQHQSSCQKTLL